MMADDGLPHTTDVDGNLAPIIDSIVLNQQWLGQTGLNGVATLVTQTVPRLIRHP